MTRRDGGGAAVSTAMRGPENDGTAPWLCLAVQLSNGFMSSPPWGGHLRPIDVRSDIRMGNPSVPQPRDFGRIQYWSTEIDLGSGEEDVHFEWKWWWGVGGEKALGVKLPFFATRKTQQLHFSVKIIKWERSEPPT